MAIISLNSLIQKANLSSADIVNQYVLVTTGVNDAYTAANGGYFAYQIVAQGNEYAVYPQKKNGNGYENDGNNTVVMTMNTKAEVLYMVEHGAGNFYDTVQYINNPVVANIGPERTLLMALNDYLQNHFTFASYQAFITDDGAPGIYTPNLVGITVAPTTATLSLAGTKTQQLTPTFNPTTFLDKDVTYATSDATIATVSASGLVTGIAVGNVTITVASVYDPTKMATVAITVTA